MGKQYSRRTIAAPGYDAGALQVRFAEVAISIAAFKACRATPVTLVAAPGAGKALALLAGAIIYDFAAVYTETTDNLEVKYTNGSGASASQTIETTGFIDQSNDEVRPILPLLNADMAVNAPLVLHNTGDGEFGGTGSPIRVKIAYLVYDTGL